MYECLIICFRNDSLSSNLKDKNTHLLIVNLFHVIFYILGTHYLHVSHPGKDKSFLKYPREDSTIVLNCIKRQQNCKGRHNETIYQFFPLRIY